ncbi:MAG: hypothetical protein AAFX99_07800 [Myxococcota bacterium]
MTRTHHVKTTLLGCILLLCGGCKALPISSFGGCGSDNDCKGQRICIDRACRGPEAESIGTTASQEGLLCGGPQSDGTLRVGQCASSCPTDSGTVPMTFQNVKGSRGCGPGAVCCLHTSGNIAGASKGSAKDAQARWLDAKLKARVVVLDWGVRESEIKVNTEGDTHKLKIPIVYGSMKTTFTFDDNGLPIKTPWGSAHAWLWVFWRVRAV